MSNREKFAAFKEKLVQENEKKYGAEAREKYGNDAVDASNRKMLCMTEAQMKHFQELEAEIRTRLEQAVLTKLPTDGDEAEAIMKLHKEWLTMAWKHYTPEMHKGVAQMYVADERFTAYYDKNVSGCAQFLMEAVCRFA